MKARRERQPSRKPFVRARKSLGQNFLVDKNAVMRIIDACALRKDETVLEIGPGTGLLTREIAPRVRRLIAVETDPRFCEALGHEFRGRNVEIVHADFLKVDVTTLAGSNERLKVIGNLPYYITTPIIAAILESRRLFCELFLTVQLEFAQRIAAGPGTKEYGAFSCFVQYYAEPALLFKIKNSSFKPKPSVDSCFLKLILRDTPACNVLDEELFFKIIRASFQQRRKTLANSLSVLFTKEMMTDAFKAAGLDPQRRAESMSLSEFARLADVLKAGLNHWQSQQ